MSYWRWAPTNAGWPLGLIRFCVILWKALSRLLAVISRDPYEILRKTGSPTQNGVKRIQHKASSTRTQLSSFESIAIQMLLSILYGEWKLTHYGHNHGFGNRRWSQSKRTILCALFLSWGGVIKLPTCETSTYCIEMAKKESVKSSSEVF